MPADNQLPQDSVEATQDGDATVSRATYKDDGRWEIAGLLGVLGALVLGLGAFGFYLWHGMWNTDVDFWRCLFGSLGAGIFFGLIGYILAFIVAGIFKVRL